MSVKNLYEPSQNMAALHGRRIRHCAHITLYKRDTDYMVKDNQVVIVDEFTGPPHARPPVVRRTPPRPSKRKRACQDRARESNPRPRSLFQNYFRMYEKLVWYGLETAETEASGVSRKIYKLEVMPVSCSRTERR